MFRRRKQRGWGSRLRDFVWPKSGFRRAVTYLLHRVRRLPGSPYSIAAGFACGTAMSFTPFVFFHFIGAGLLAWAIRANILASAIGTAVGNPWTFPFIWVGVYRLGCLMLGWEAGHGLPEGIALAYIFSHPSTIYDHLVAIFLPMTIGGLPAGFLVWLVSYLPIRMVVADYQDQRRRRRERRRKSLRQRAEGTEEETSR